MKRSEKMKEKHVADVNLLSACESVSDPKLSTLERHFDARYRLSFDKLSTEFRLFRR
jgi:hypothetical protein